MPTDKAANRVSGFTLDASGAFYDPKKEAFAKSWAKDGMLKRACEAADIALPTGTKWRGHAEMEERVRALRATSETYVGVSKAYIIEQLRQNAANAATAGKYRESNDAYALLWKMQSTDKDLAPGLDAGAGGPAADMTAEQLAEARAKAFPAAKQLPAETREMVESDDGVWVPTAEPPFELIPLTEKGERFVADMERSLTVKYGELAKPFDGGEFEGPVESDEG